MKQLHAAKLTTCLGTELILKRRYMKEAIRHKVLLIVLVFITFTAVAQDFEDKRNTNATLMKINDNNDKEEKPVRCYITYSDYTKKLEVKRDMPLRPGQTEISEDPADSNSFKFDLVFDLDKNKMQENIASGKIFSTYGVFTFNNYTKDVLVQYSSLPGRVHSPDNFNISLMVNITPEDFGTTDKNSEWILMVNNAIINQTDE